MTFTGRCSDIMVPMAIPSVGGMAFAVITMFVVPVLYCQVKEWGVRGKVLSCRKRHFHLCYSKA